MFNMSAIAATLFLGGWNGPTFGLTGFLAWVLPIIYFFIKTFALIFIFMWVRATLPRLRYDQLMRSAGNDSSRPLSWLVLSSGGGVRPFGAPWT